jgi:hypothetical protein
MNQIRRCKINNQQQIMKPSPVNYQALSKSYYLHELSTVGICNSNLDKKV